jgi:hypothetical protein
MINLSVEPGGVIGIATGLRTGLLRVRIPIRARDFYILKIAQTVSGAHPACYSMRTDVSYPRVTRPERESSHTSTC